MFIENLKSCVVTWATRGSLADDFDQDSFLSPSVELAVEDLLPGAEVEFAAGHGNNDLPTHDLTFHVRVGIVFSHVVAILGHRFVGASFSSQTS